jgi:hypothetical protein
MSGRIPGANLLSMAMGVIGAQAVVWSRYEGAVTSATGRQVDTYLAPVTVAGGSLQPATRARSTRDGIDYGGAAVRWFAPVAVVGVERDMSGDLIDYAGSRYRVQTVTDWLAQDGWRECVCVRVGATPDA